MNKKYFKICKGREFLSTPTNDLTFRRKTVVSNFMAISDSI